MLASDFNLTAVIVHNGIERPLAEAAVSLRGGKVPPVCARLLCRFAIQKMCRTAAVARYGALYTRQNALR